MDSDIVCTFLQGLVTGGAGPASQWLCERWSWFQKQASRVKLVVAVGVSSFIGAASYALTVAWTCQSVPVGWQAWSKALVIAAILASGFGQIIHRLGKKH